MVKGISEQITLKSFRIYFSNNSKCYTYCMKPDFIIRENIFGENYHGEVSMCH
jgi:hypothetical protein